ncbi:DNA polymerase III subunit beta [candidate division WOR-1 bacterium RIFCSPHIGHO2_01_FULL_53_15]|uniref:Beta sliding clamp n=1 Tax=candidate division WOR-1 bacterium RIFCSPHIGHO2_01_FULL_53_15 TaxID=1802564 RepID=A0A1F4PZ70_UNCSA|nr:MAG: DNA polymerase III subunit beta [candidate division WOR-1 bacterium RIFCSPHIGHO2_01_FULL_53_15]OGC10623.1 MAG: DNA polymerase III subunit beta [candidate division WOR-1 bacterium RIFCSPHIGHO2_02_FULL_53_26]
MEFICEKKELQTGVAAVERLVAARSTMPIIGNVLFEATRSGLKLSANNLEIGLELVLKANVTKEGAVLLPAKTLSGIVSKLPDTSVGFKLGENGTVRISYDQSHFNLHSLPPDEFPALPKVKEGRAFSVDPELFATMVSQTIFSVSGSEDKYILTGVLVETGKSGVAGDNSTLRLVATDGYRLARSGGKTEAKGEAGVNVIVPARAMSELSKIIEGGKGEALKVVVSGEQISFRYGDAHLVSRLIQGQFPDYKQVIPKKSLTKITLNTREFLRAAERAAVIASGSANVTLFEVRSGKMHLSANTPDVGNVDEVLAAEIKGPEKARASFNIRLITDVLSVIESEKTTVELGEGLSPGLIRPEGSDEYLYVVMPIRTQEAV